MTTPKLLMKYAFPLLLLAFVILFFVYPRMKEGFDGFLCDTGTSLRNGGCYSCPSTYTLTHDYYNPKCVSNNGKNKTTAPIVTTTRAYGNSGNSNNHGNSGNSGNSNNYSGYNGYSGYSGHGGK